MTVTGTWLAIVVADRIFQLKAARSRVRAAIIFFGIILLVAAVLALEFSGPLWVAVVCAVIDGYLLSVLSSTQQIRDGVIQDWSPRFWTAFLPALFIGLLLAILLRTTSSHAGGVGGTGESARTGGLTLLLLVPMLGAQIAFLIVCGLRLREKSRLGASRSARFLRLLVVSGASFLASVSPMVIMVGLMLTSADIILIGLIVFTCGTVGLKTAFNVLRDWDEKPSLRKDFAQYLIQSGGILALLWIGLCVASAATVFPPPAPALIAEILRTLLYSATLLLVPQAWWILHLARSTPPETDQGGGKSVAARPRVGVRQI